jgi:hypothetical protein
MLIGLLHATGKRKRLYVTAVGGPGASGLQSADSYTEGFDPVLHEHFDIVFFDRSSTAICLVSSGRLEILHAQQP